jgi:general stress protein YciG
MHHGQYKEQEEESHLSQANTQPDPGQNAGRSPDELVVDVRGQVKENVDNDPEREIGREGGEGRLHALHDAEQGALERRGYGGDDAPYAQEESPSGNVGEDLDDRSEQIDIGRCA